MPRAMDDKSASRIAKARGPNDEFAKRAQKSARNYEDRAGSSSDGSWRKKDSGKKKDGGSKSK
ncbi:Uu.00g137970.m01.CDS01 [Anthostomella pinea]|uniref:Uu.00g137970.m01.CDS01 n=1 Tax=Anthostomella pinea TaxID=933095 RepID=A0AAI8VPK8_9PEZI|nr:Uu.00g137970.m01.CDS01 [Anthostomella pinea]